MDLLHITIFQTETPKCPHGTCDQLENSIQASFPDTKLSYLHRGNRQELKHCTPDIIILPSQVWAEAEFSLHQFQTQFPTTSFLGLLCSPLNSQKRIDRKNLLDLDDFLSCPFQESDVFIRIYKILHQRISANSHSETNCSPSTLWRSTLIGKSQAFSHAVSKISLFTKLDTPVLIHGETGTGKELFARAIHYQSSRRRNPFIPVNCGALPDHLLENELFGHAKGAFTDASTEQKGLLQEAEGGTIFLDEIDALSQHAQIKLLRFLQEKEYRPLGSSKTVVANVRILAASNAEIKDLLHHKKIREDFYYRLNILSLKIPPLRERIGDIPLLAHYFMEKYGKGAVHPQYLSDEALTKLSAYTWPGNVRELEAVILRTLAFSLTPRVLAKDIDLPAHPKAPSSFMAPFRKAKMAAIAIFEQRYLTNLLVAHNGNVSQAAKAAGKERRSFQRLLQKHDIESWTYRSQD